MTLTKRHHKRITGILLLILTASIYWPGLNGGFLFDDYPNIVTNSRVHAEQLDMASLKRAAAGYEPGTFGRPAATISFAIDYSIAGKTPRQYKLTSLLVHLTNTLLAFILLTRLLSLPAIDFGRPVLAAFTLAMLWSSHPLQISTVLYVVQRMETLSLTFVLMGLLAYVHGRVRMQQGSSGWTWLTASACLASLGLLSKETAVLFPLYTLALELTIFRFEASKRSRRLLVTGYLLAGTIAAIAYVGWILPQYMAEGAFSGRHFSLYERLLSQCRILPMYIGQILLPLPGSMPFYYDNFSKSTDWLAPATTLLGALFLAGLLLVAWRSRKRYPLTSLGIFWFFAAHALTSNVFNLELVFEHRNYFALLGVLLVAADLIRRIPLRDGPALKHVAVGATVLCFGFLALIRSATWGNEFSLAMDLVAKNRTSPRASTDLATLYVGMSNSNPASPFYSFAKQEFERAADLPDSSPLPEHALILMAATTGQPVDTEWWQRLIRKIETRPISPQELLSVTGLMNQRYAGIELDDQQLSAAYQALLKRGNQPSHMYARFGDYALRYLHDDALADDMFVAALDAAKNDKDFARRMISTLQSAGHVRQAKRVLEHGTSLGLLEAHEKSN